MADGSDSAEELPSLRGSRSRVCKQCRFSTTDARAFSAHQLNAHRQEATQIYPCDLCEYSTGSFTEWQRHQRHHASIRRHEIRSSRSSTEDEARESPIPTSKVANGNAAVPILARTGGNSAATPPLAAGSISESEDVISASRTEEGRVASKDELVEGRAENRNELEEGRVENQEEEGGTESMELPPGYEDAVQLKRSLPTRNYTCQVCFTATTSAKQHLRHLVDVHGQNINIYECDICEYATRWKHKLPRHIKCHFAPGSRSPTGNGDKPPSMVPRVTSAEDASDISALVNRPVFEDANGDSSDYVGTSDKQDNNNNGDEPATKDGVFNYSGDQRNTASDLDGVREESKIDGTIGSYRKPPVREAVDPAKYVELEDPVNGTRYSCSVCGNVYKWRKSLNKHWKDKHERDSGAHAHKAIPVLSVPKVTQVKPVGTSVPNLSASVPNLSANKVLNSSGAYSATSDDEEFSFEKYERQYGSSSVLYGDSPSWDEGAKDNPPSSTYQGGESYEYEPGEKAPTGLFQTSSLPEKSQSSIFPSYSDDKPHSSSLLKALSGPRFGSSHPRSLLRPKPRLAFPVMNIKQEPPSDVFPVKYSGNSMNFGYKAIKVETEDNKIINVLDLSRKSTPTPSSPHEGKQAVDSDDQDWSEAVEEGDIPFFQDEPLNLCVRKSSDKYHAKPEVPSVQKLEPSGAFRKYSHMVKAENDDYNPRLPCEELQCSKCAYIARDKYEYDKHMEIHLPARAQRCGECKEVFLSVDELNHHFSTHHKRAPSDNEQLPLEKTKDALYFEGPAGEKGCYVCSALYATDFELVRHFDIMHPAMPNPYRKRPSPGSGPTEADQGHDAKRRREAPLWDSGSELMKHLLPRTSEGLYECTMCPFSSHTEGKIALHMKNVHQVPVKHSPTPRSSVERTSVSSVDSSEPGGVVFPQRQAVSMSPLTVRTEGTADVPLAQLTPTTPTGSQASLSPRSRSGNSEMLLPYKCSVCEYRARWPSEITQHMKNHSDEKPYLCPGCPYRSKWKWDVVKHMKRCKDALGGTIDDVIDTTGNLERRRRKYAPRKKVQSAPEFEPYKPLSRGPPNVVVVPNSDTPKSIFHHSGDGAQPTQYPSIMKRLEMQRKSPEEGVPLAASGVVDSQADPVNLVKPRKDSAPRQFVPVSTVDSYQFTEDSGDKDLVIDEDSDEWGEPMETHQTPPSSVTETLKSNATPSTESFQVKPTAVSPRLKPANKDKSQTNGNGQHPCRYCPFIGQSPAELKRHSAVHSDQKPFACDDCDYRTKWKCDLKKHMRIYNHASRCATLTKKMTKARSFEDSPSTPYRELDMTAVPQELRLLKCDKCEYVTYKRLALESHQRIHQSRDQMKVGKGLRCRQCGFEATDLPAFLQHNLSHAGDNKDQSDSDAVASNDGGGVKLPLSVKHRRKPIAILRCSKCPFTCNKKANLQLHETMHGMKSDKALECQYCDYCVFSKGLLSQHMHLHKEYRAAMANKFMRGESDAKPAGATRPGVPLLSRQPVLRCDKCPYLTNHRFKYEKHLQLHARRSRFRCEWCNFSVERLNSLYRHARSVHHATLTRDASYYEQLAMSMPTDDAACQLNDTRMMDTDESDSESSADEELPTDYTKPFQHKLNKEDSSKEEVNAQDTSNSDESKTSTQDMKCLAVEENNNNIVDGKASIPASLDKITVSISTLETKSSTITGTAESQLSGKEVEPPKLRIEISTAQEETSAKPTEPQLKENGEQGDNTSLTVDGKTLKIEQNGGKLLYRCTLCIYTTVNSTNAKNHIRNHGSVRKYPCDYCDYGSDQLRHIMGHMTTIHPEECKKAFTEECEEDGDETGTPSDNSTRQEENVKTTLEADTSSSQTRENDEEMHVDPNDKADMKEKSALQYNDDVSHAENKPTKSVINAEKEVKNEGQASKSEHETMEEEHKTSDEKFETEFYTCSHCPFRTREVLHLHRHAEMHEYKGRFTCKYCNYSLDRLNLLIKHMKVHSDSYKVSTECLEEQECAMVDKDSGAAMSRPLLTGGLPLKRPRSTEKYQELVSRLKEGRYDMGVQVAPLAGTQRPLHAVTNKLLKKSVFGLTGRSRIVYRCALCPFTSGSKSNMNKHKNAHLVKNKYQCDKCSYSARKWTLLQWHQKAHRDAEGNRDTNGQCRYITVDLDGSESEAVPGAERHMRHDQINRDGNQSFKDEPEYITEPEMDLGETSGGQTVRGLLLSSNQQGLRPIAPKPSNMGTSSQIAQLYKKKKKTRYHCQKCPYGSNSLFEYQKHTQLHGSPLRYRCDYCDYSLSRMNLMFQHRRLHSEEPGFVRTPPPTDLINTDLSVNYKRPEPPTSFNGHDGSYSDSNELPNGELVIDEEVNSPDSSGYHHSFSEPEPEILTSLGLYSKQRLSQNSSQKPVSGAKAKELHAAYSRPKPPHSENLKHVSKILTVSVEGKKRPKVYKMYKCPLCPFSCGSKQGYTIHENLHNSSGRYRCDHCSYTVNRLNLLLQHSKLHMGIPKSVKITTGTKPLKCPKCPFRTHSPSILSSHLRMHTSGGKYTCQFCDYSIDRYNLIKQHIKIHFSYSEEGEDCLTAEEDSAGPGGGEAGEFMCDRCPFTTASGFLYTKHMEGHDEQFAYQCKHCDYSCDDGMEIIHHTELHFAGNHGASVDHYDDHNALFAQHSGGPTHASTVAGGEKEQREQPEGSHGNGVQDMTMLRTPQNLIFSKRENYSAERKLSSNSQSTENSSRKSSESDPETFMETKNKAAGSSRTTLRCQYCERPFSDRSQLERHEQLHLIGC